MTIVTRDRRVPIIKIKKYFFYDKTMNYLSEDLFYKLRVDSMLF